MGEDEENLKMNCGLQCQNAAVFTRICYMTQGAG